MKFRIARAASAFLATFLIAGVAAAADQGADPKLAKALTGVPVTLEQAIAASAAEGEPISAKYEIEVDALQLSVYTMAGESFKEVIVDHRTGKIGKVIPITDTKDLGEAQDQKSVMLYATRSLRDATGDAVSMYPGYRAVSAMPDARDGRLGATILLTNGRDWKTVHTPLDWGQ